MTNTLTVHRSPSGQADAVRIVPDGFRPSVFVLPPAALLSRGLWGACLLWLAVFTLLVGAAVTGMLAPEAALAALLVLHVVLAIDAPERERVWLRKRGWSEIASSAGVTDDVERAAADAPPNGIRGGAPPRHTDVIGLFPGTAPGNAPGAGR